MLEYELINGRGFIDKAAKAFIKEFKETYVFAGLNNQDNKSVEEENDSDVSPPINTSGREAPATPHTQINTNEVTTRLTQGKVARLFLPTDMNQKDFQLLVRWLDLLKEAALYEGSEDNTNDQK